MRKFLILAIAALGAMASVESNAQDVLDAGEYNRPYLGLRISYESPIPGKWNLGGEKVDMYKNGSGFDAGVVYNIPLWKNLYFEPGIELYYNAMGVDIETSGDPDGTPNITDINASVRRFGLRIPLLAGYRFDLATCSLYAFTGPVVEAGIIGRSHTSAKYNGESYSEGSNYYVEGGFKRLDVAWKIGAGVSINQYYIGLSGNLGMCNILRGYNGVSMRENLFQFTLGYNF